MTVIQFANDLDARFTNQSATLAAGNQFNWSQETFNVGKTVTYNFEKPTSGVVTLDTTYYTKAFPTVEKQLATAGYRLASLLNGIFDSSNSAGITAWNSH